MRELLKVGQIIRSRNGKRYSVNKLLGSGGQGEVYSVNVDGREKALKWYYPHTATEQQKRAIEDIIKHGKPNDKFLWPIEIVESSGIKGFGYLMDIRPSNYKNIVDIMKRRVE